MSRLRRPGTPPPVDGAWTFFCDRDGVLNYRSAGDYIRRASDLRWIPGALDGFCRLGARTARTFIVTNQQGVGKGVMTPDELDEVDTRTRAELGAAGARLDEIYYCTALASTNAPCRKPAPGMALQARRDFPGVDFARSFIVGDSLSDMGFGRAIGAYCIFVGEGSEADDPRVDAYLPSLYEAANWLLAS